MFIDRSVVVAMMTDEGAARTFATRMLPSTVRLTSPLIAARAAIDVSAHLGLSLAEATEATRTFLQLMNIQSVAVPPRAAFLALEAYAAFGTATDGPDFDDCMTYACARYYRQPLLFCAGGFAATDIEIA